MGVFARRLRREVPGAGVFAFDDGCVGATRGDTIADPLDADPCVLQVVVQPLDRVAGHGQHHPVEACHGCAAAAATPSTPPTQARRYPTLTPSQPCRQ